MSQWHTSDTRRLGRPARRKIVADLETSKADRSHLFPHSEPCRDVIKLFTPQCNDSSVYENFNTWLDHRLGGCLCNKIDEVFSTRSHGLPAQQSIVHVLMTVYVSAVSYTRNVMRTYMDIINHYIFTLQFNSIIIGAANKWKQLHKTK